MKAINKRLKIIYIASDDLRAINQAEFIKESFRKDIECFDGVRLPSRLLAGEFPSVENVFYVPHGIDPGVAEFEGASPYSGGSNAVSVGSMLLDVEFFYLAAELHPTLTFHLVGSGLERWAGPSNVRLYPEMRFASTIPFIRYADIGIAAYNASAHRSLADTSMKMIQYGHFGVPSVCPVELAVGRNKFGYVRGDRGSIKDAISLALRAPRVRTPALTWSDVVDRILEPWAFEDTDLTIT
jgi:2-beta-glucuronyltransferase